MVLSALYSGSYLRKDNAVIFALTALSSVGIMRPIPDVLGASQTADGAGNPRRKATETGRGMHGSGRARTWRSHASDKAADAAPPEGGDAPGATWTTLLTTTEIAAKTVDDAPPKYLETT